VLGTPFRVVSLFAGVPAGEILIVLALREAALTMLSSCGRSA